MSLLKKAAEAMQGARAAIASVRTEVQRRTSAGEVPTLTRTEALAVVRGPVDRATAERELAEARAALADTRRLINERKGR